mmetsp:Transcript_21045/g.68160  ORF Transcript_21045/g.68160 Transcript_21045/m.68160 type:complete len:246 (-) Transcript_21045:1176-1913(-)
MTFCTLQRQRAVAEQDVQIRPVCLMATLQGLLGRSGGRSAPRPAAARPGQLGDQGLLPKGGRLQHLLGDLRADRRKPSIHDMDRIGHLPGRHPRLLAVQAGIAGRPLEAGFDGHPRDDRLAGAGRMIDADDGGLANGWMLIQDLLDVARRHVEAPVRRDDILDASRDVDEAVLREPTNIPGANGVAVGHSLLGLLGVVKIAHHHQFGLCANLPDAVLFGRRRHAGARPLQVFDEKILRTDGLAGT